MFEIGRRYIFAIRINGQIRNVEAAVDQYNPQSGLVQIHVSTDPNFDHVGPLDRIIFSVHGDTFVSANYNDG